MPKLGIAQPNSSRYHRVQNRLQIKGRAADDFEDVARCGLVFERLFEVVRAFAQFAEQPRIFDRDDRLRCEVLYERNFLLGERPDFPAAGRNHAEQLVVFAEWHVETRPYSGVLARRLDHRMVDLREIGDVDEAFAVEQRPGERVVGAAVAVSQLLCEPSRIRVCRHRTESFAFAQD